MIKRSKIHIDLYDYNICVAFVKNPVDYVNNVLSKKFPGIRKEEPNAFSAVHIYDKQGTSWIVYPPKADIELIAHEVSHAVDEIMRWTSLEGTEARAFLTGHILKNIWNKV